MMTTTYTFFIAVVIYRIVAGLFGQDHLWLLNFSPLAALALCGPVVFPRRTALLLPLSSLLASDFVLNIHYGATLLNAEMLVRYAVLIAISLLGLRLRECRQVWVFLLASLVASIGFYLITNTASWFSDPGYMKTAAGWWQALTVGLPGYPPTWFFFRNSAVGDAFCTLALSGCFVAARTKSKVAAKMALVPNAASA